MTADVTETTSPEELLGQFRSRYQGLLKDNREMADKIKSNEATALKLLGAIETLEYLNPSETTEETAPEETPAAADA